MQSAVVSHAVRYPVLDGVRGLAIALVSASHASNLHDWWFSGTGQFGVWLFFVLSAFLLSLYFFEDPSRMLMAHEWANYIFRRVVRIYPLYALSLVVGGLIPGYWTVFGAREAFLLIEPTFWSVYVECRWYLMLPMFLFVLQYGGQIHWSVPLISVTCLICGFCISLLSFNLVAGYDFVPTSTFQFIEFVPCFVVGMLAAWGFVRLRHLRPRIASAWWLDGLIVALILAPWLASSYILNTVFQINLQPDYYHLWFWPWSSLFALFLLAVMMSDGWAAQFLRSKPMINLGYISYSIYLFQDYWLTYLAKTLSDPIPYCVVSLCTVIVCSNLLFAYVERPLSRLTLLSRLRSPSSSAKWQARSLDLSTMPSGTEPRPSGNAIL